MHRLQLIAILLIFQLGILSGQDNSWSFGSLSYIDNAVTINTVGSTNTSKSLLIPKKNFGQMHQFSRNFRISEKFGASVGAAYGYNQTNIGLMTTTDILGNPSIPDAIQAISFFRIHYLGFLTGISYTANLNTNLFFTVNIKGGLMYPIRANFGQGRSVGIGMDITNAIQSRFIINEEGLPNLLISPEVYFNYRVENTPISVYAGIGLQLAPKKIIRGSATIFEDFESFESWDTDLEIPISDEIIALGLTIGFKYHLGQN